MLFYVQLGDGTRTDRLSPARSDESDVLSRIDFIAAGHDHTCALTTSASGLYCWGHNANGQVSEIGCVAAVLMI